MLSVVIAAMHFAIDRPDVTVGEVVAMAELDGSRSEIGARTKVLEASRLKSMARWCVTPLPAWTNRAEVPAQRLESVSLDFDFPHRAEAHAAEKGQRWTPALNGVLKQECGHESRERQKAPVHGSCEDHTVQSQSRGIRLQHPHNVPFFVQLSQAAVDPVQVRCVPANAF